MTTLWFKLIDFESLIESYSNSRNESLSKEEGPEICISSLVILIETLNSYIVYLQKIWRNIRVFRKRYHRVGCDVRESTFLKKGGGCTRHTSADVFVTELDEDCRMGSCITPSHPSANAYIFRGGGVLGQTIKGSSFVFMTRRGFHWSCSGINASIRVPLGDLTGLRYTQTGPR